MIAGTSLPSKLVQSRKVHEALILESVSSVKRQPASENFTGKVGFELRA